MLYIGIDLGTSAVKLLLMDEAGNVKNMVSREYPISFPKTGWSEQEPEEWYEKTIDGIKELVHSFDRTEIKGIGIGGQMHGLVALDESGRPVRPAILWNDGRTVEETAYLNETIGEEKLAECTGNIAFAGFTAPKILWMQKNEKELWNKVKMILLPKDYLVYRLTGEFSTDYSDASGMLLLDVKKKKWSGQMLRICNISEKMLPSLHESFDVVGELKEEIERELLLPKGVKVVAGAGDNAAAAVGCGCVGNGGCNISLGTSGTVFVSGKEYFDLDNHAIHSFAHADGGYHLMGCMLSAASCNKWWMDEIIETTDYKGEQEKIRAGKNSVYFLPYLMGERSPHNDASCRGAFIGMSMNTSRADMTRAVLEGVAYGLRDSLEAARKSGLTIDKSRLCGGGAKSVLWQRILAAVLKLTLEIPEVEEGPSYGGAILAAVGCGEYPDVESAVKAVVRTEKIVEPDASEAEVYEEGYEHFKKLYPALKGLF